MCGSYIHISPIEAPHPSSSVTTMADCAASNCAGTRPVRGDDRGRCPTLEGWKDLGSDQFGDWELERQYAPVQDEEHLSGAL